MARRRPPRWTQLEVWDRDGGLCAFVEKDKRCQEFVDLAVEPWGVIPFGLEDDPCCYRLLCRAHAALIRWGVREWEWAQA